MNTTHNKNLPDKVFNPITNTEVEIKSFEERFKLSTEIYNAMTETVQNHGIIQQQMEVAVNVMRKELAIMEKMVDNTQKHFDEFFKTYLEKLHKFETFTKEYAVEVNQYQLIKKYYLIIKQRHENDKL